LRPVLLTDEAKFLKVGGLWNLYLMKKLLLD